MFKKLICLTCLFLVLGVASDALADLVVHYKLNDGSGTVASDSSGNGFDGTINGSPNWVTGYMGGALELTGGDNITFPAADIGLRSDIGSIALWLNADTPSGINTMFSAGDNTAGGGFGAENEIHVHLEQPQAGIWDGGECSFFAIANPNTFLHTDPTKGAPGNTPIDPVLLADQVWHHVAAIWGDGSVKLYVDGVLIVEDTYNPTNYELSNMFIGQMLSPQRFFTGIIDDVQLYNHALSEAEVALAMAGGEPLGPATNPNPEDEATDIPRDDVILSWTPGPYAATHDVYLGKVADDVNNADAGSSLLIGPANDANNFNAGRLEFGQTYFWRIDEVNAPPDNTVFKGKLWSFTVEPYAIAIPGGNITVTASSQAEGQLPENTINGSGLVDDLHSTDVGGMWLTSESDTAGPHWIQYEFDRIYKLDEMVVWNYNGETILAGLGLKDVAVEYSTDGDAWTVLDSVTEFPQATGAEEYASNLSVDFDGAAAKFVKISATSNWLELFPQYGLSEVRFMVIPVSAREPSPESGATDVAIDATLEWRAGRGAAEHNVLLSTDEQAVIDGTAPAVTVSQNSYSPSDLVLGGSYSWRVDEVNNAEATPVWQGETWNFTTQEYRVVDDFESYNDILEGQEGSNLVYLTWEDGYLNPATNGSTMGYVTGASMETDIVYGGSQSAPLLYNNTSASLSEVTVDPGNLPIGRNWSAGSPTTLVLWIHGDPANTGNDQLYVKVGNSKFPYDGDIARPQWNPMIVDLTGVNLNNVSSLTVGVERSGGSGGSGTVFIDEIRLYGTAPAVPAEEIWIEAEAADSLTAPMVISSDPNASGGQYIAVEPGNGSSAAPPTQGVARYSFTVQGGVYKISGRVIAPSGVDDSFWVNIPGTTTQTTNHTSGWVRWNSIQNGATWHWDFVHSDDDSGDPEVEWTMAAGTYTLEIGYREDGTLLDALVITKID